MFGGGGDANPTPLSKIKSGFKTPGLDDSKEPTKKSPVSCMCECRV